MIAQAVLGRLSKATLLLLASASAFAQAPAPEAAVAQTLHAKDLKWGECPAFLPKGCRVAVLHGDPAKNNADVLFKVPGKSILPPHTHTSAERMVLISGELHVTFDGQKTQILKPGTYAYGPAKLPHKGYCASKTECVLFIAFELPVDAIPVESAAK